VSYDIAVNLALVQQFKSCANLDVMFSCYWFVFYCTVFSCMAASCLVMYMAQHILRKKCKILQYIFWKKCQISQKFRGTLFHYNNKSWTKYVSSTL